MTTESTVYVVDDDAAVRTSLSRLLSSANLAVRAFGSAEEFLADFSPSGPSCIILDVRMSGMSGLELQKLLAGRRETAPVLLISGHGDIEMAVGAMKDGAFDFLTKPYNARGLLEKVQAALRADETRRAELATRSSAKAALARLSPREIEVLEGLTHGESVKQIAARLGLSRKTVDIHRAHVLMKVGVDSVAELVHVVLRARRDSTPDSR
ncbi:MAG: response regulator [Phycisphaerae bacterium]